MLGVNKDDSINPQQVRQIMLSGLLCPTRQSQMGSCFATSIVIQQDTYAMGLRQKLEDFLMMMAKGALTRSNKNLTMDYPVYVEDLLRETLMDDDHLLNRSQSLPCSAPRLFYPILILIVLREKWIR